MNVLDIVGLVVFDAIFLIAFFVLIIEYRRQKSRNEELDRERREGEGD